MQHGPPRRRRARPVGDAPVDALLPRVEDITKGWLLAVLEQAPLEDAPAILAADLARDGPRICEAIVRALADDDDLRRLEPGGALEPLVALTGELAGAQFSEPVSRAVDALHAIVWSALRGELPGADADEIAALAERLQLVVELVRAAALRRSETGAAAGEGVYPIRATRAADLPTSAPREVEEPESAGLAPDALWIGAVEDEIAHAEQAGVPLSLLLVELNDADRVEAAESPTEASATFGRFAQALRGVVRRRDLLACETESRAWIIARDTGRVGAQALASRAASAVSEARPWRGARLTVSAGLAVLGEDGRDSASLIEVAEEAKFAAAAAGVPVVHELPPEGNGETGGAGPRLVS
jgi:GGDEF domain-containing protein